MTASAATQELRVAMVGNPNVGKSTLFNTLTGLRQRVANYAGVTVDVHEGHITLGEQSVLLLDLPGAYSLRPRSEDEAVVERVLTHTTEDVPPVDGIVVVLDASNLRRNLFLLSEVMDLGRPVIVAINMVDEARRGGAEVPTEILRTLTGLEVIETVAPSGEGVDELRAAIGRATAPATRRWSFSDCAHEEQLARASGATTWQRLKALEAETPATRDRVTAARYAWIGQVLQGVTGGGRARATTDKIDRILLHPVLGPVAFLMVMGLVFQAIFSWAGPVMDGIEALFGLLTASLKAGLPSLVGATLTDLVTDGALAGVGAVVVFLPQIVILFLLLGLLEDTGYMARAAFLVDRPLRAVGLSGRSFIPLLSSFACAIPGVMATRTIPSRFERTLAILAAPLMTCSARLPVYTLLIAAFVPPVAVAGVFNLKGVVMLGLYLSGLSAGVTVAFLVNRARRKQRRGRELPMVVELPPYRLPTARGVFLKLKVRVGDFLKRAGTVIFVVSVVLWVLMAYPKAPEVAGQTAAERGAVQLRQSYAGRLGQAIEPAVKPLGYDWKMGVGLVASFAAREVFVSTMGIVYSVGDEADEESADLRAALQNARDPVTGKRVFTLATVFSLLAFYVFALQCGATVAVVKRETGSWKFAGGQVVAYLALAYVAAFVTYRVVTAMGYGA